MAVDHLSLYQLTIEPGTRFGDLAARGRLRGLPDAEAAADMYLATQEICAARRPAGLRDLEPRPARGARAGTTSSTGAMATMPASAPARTAG